MTSIAVFVISPISVLIYCIPRLVIQNKRRRTIVCLIPFSLWFPLFYFDLLGKTFYNPTTGTTQTIYPSISYLLFTIACLILMLIDLSIQIQQIRIMDGKSEKDTLNEIPKPR